MFAILPEKIRAAGRRRYQNFSLFPAALRDLALVVEATRPAEEVRRQLLKVAVASTGPAFGLENIAVFDVYQGPGIPAGKKSVAFALSFRSTERTLTDEEVNVAFAKIQQEIVASGFATVRT